MMPTVASDYAALIRPTHVQVVSSVARPLNPAYSRNAKSPAFAAAVFVYSQTILKLLR